MVRDRRLAVNVLSSSRLWSCRCRWSLSFSFRPTTDSEGVSARHPEPGGRQHSRPEFEGVKVTTNPASGQSTMKRKVTKDHAILLSFWNRMPVFRLTNFPFQRLLIVGLWWFVSLSRDVVSLSFASARALMFGNERDPWARTVSAWIDIFTGLWPNPGVRDSPRPKVG